MKKTLLLSALAVATAMTVSAKTADELRIYINPGHGSWTANDRPMGLVPDQREGSNAYQRTNTDTTMFYESNTDLEKGFGVLERLITYGIPFDRTKNQDNPDPANLGAARDLEQNIVMSRVKNGPFHADNGTENQLGSATPSDIYAYNRNLPEICEEVTVNNFDMFISIHSNAATEGTTTNYPLFLYRGYDDCHEDTGAPADFQTTSRKMADACWGYAIGNPHAVWTSYKTSKNLRGDINFYGSGSLATRSNGYQAKGYLGVLKHNAPGFLVEGYFHTYQPARHRAMNWDVCRLEGNAYARGIADYFGLPKESFGTVYGIVRDMHEKFSDVNYKPNPTSDDIYKPLNGATVKLMKGEEVVAEKVTDNYYNGAFVFDGVEPGDYTVVVTHPDYKAETIEGETTNVANVTVKAATDTYPVIFLEATSYEPPKEVFVTYPDPASTIKGVEPANEYKFATEYADEEIAQLEGKIVRRTVIDKGMMYILAIDRLPEFAQVPEQKPVPTILVYDLAKKEVVAEVSTEGTFGTIQDVADIQVTDDHYLIAVCQTKTQYDASNVQDLPDGTKEPRGTLYVYKWSNDENGLPTGAPEKWLSTQLSGRWYRSYAGPAFAWKGTTEDGNAIVPQPTITAPYFTMRSTSITVANGTQAGAADYLTPNDKAIISGGTNPAVGENFRMFTAPYDLDKVIYLGPDNTYEYKYLPGDNAQPTATGGEIFANMPGQVGMFKYAGASYIVAPEMADGNVVGVKLVDITKGIANAEEVSTINTTLPEPEPADVVAKAEGADALLSMAAIGEVGTTYDEVNEVYTSAWLNLYVLRDNKITKFTTKNVQQPAYKAGLAYNLHNDKDEFGFNTLNYSLSADVEYAEIVISPIVEEGGEPNTFAFEVDNTAGDHSVTPEVEEGVVFNWSLNVTTKSSPAAGEIFADKNGLTGRGGVIPITDPTQPSFGYTVVLNTMNNGVDIYNPAGEKVGDRLWKNHDLWQPNTTNQSNPFRGHERDGKAVVAAWGDAACGLVVVDPLANDEPYSLYAGTKASSGAYMYDGKNLGGGHSGLCFVGTGDDQKLYAFSEDHAGTSNTIVRYDIGTAWQITETPVEIGYGGFLANTNVDMLGYGNGFWVAQVRGSGNNAAGCPCFAYISTVTNEDGTITDNIEMTSAKVEGIDNNVGAIAITNDGKILAAPLASSIAIMNVEWDGNTPTATVAYTIPTAAESWAHARFDAVGNLHVYSRSNGGYHVYALKGEGKTTTYDAPEAVTSGVESIIVTEENVDGEATYYNINGVRVNGNMVPGVYVKVVNGVASKVIVK